SLIESQGTLIAEVKSPCETLTYLWSNGATTSSISVTSAGQYCVTVTDCHGCQGVGCGNVYIYPVPTVIVPDINICTNSLIESQGTLIAEVKSTCETLT